MNLLQIIAELQAERQRIEEAIEALERLAVGNPKRRGRPPLWLKKRAESQGSLPKSSGAIRTTQSSKKAE
jgi:hypothetical protein